MTKWSCPPKRVKIAEILPSVNSNKSALNKFQTTQHCIFTKQADIIKHDQVIVNMQLAKWSTGKYLQQCRPYNNRNILGNNCTCTDKFKIMVLYQNSSVTSINMRKIFQADNIIQRSCFCNNLKGHLNREELEQTQNRCFCNNLKGHLNREELEQTQNHFQAIRRAVPTQWQKSFRVFYVLNWKNCRHCKGYHAAFNALIWMWWTSGDYVIRPI